MTRVLLLFLFVFLVVGDTLGINVGIAPGLSVKNAFLYAIFVSIGIETALLHNRNLEMLSFIIPYGLCVFYAMSTWLFLLLFDIYPGYSALGSFINWKGGMADHLLVFLVFFYGVLNSKNAGWLLRLMIWTIVATNILSVMDILDKPNLNMIEEYRNRLTGPIGEPNQYAVVVILFLPAIAALMLIERGVLRALALVGVCTSLLALFMTGSRGGMASAVSGAVISAFFLRRFISGKATMSAIGGLAILTVFAGIVLYTADVSDPIAERLINRSTSGNWFDFTSGRSFIWATVLNEMFEQPLSLIFGYGWGSYGQFSEFTHNTHNAYLNIFFQLGLIGVLLVVFAFAAILWTARKNLQQHESDEAILMVGFMFGFMSVLVAIFFVDVPNVWILIWAYTGVAMRLSIPDSNEPALHRDHGRSTEAGSERGLTRQT